MGCFYYLGVCGLFWVWWCWLVGWLGFSGWGVLFSLLHWCFACMHIYERVWNHMELDYRQLWVPMWVLGLETGSSGRAASAFNYWAISPAPIITFLNLFFDFNDWGQILLLRTSIFFLQNLNIIIYSTYSLLTLKQCKFIENTYCKSLIIMLLCR